LGTKKALKSLIYQNEKVACEEQWQGALTWNRWNSTPFAAEFVDLRRVDRGIAMRCHIPPSLVIWTMAREFGQLTFCSVFEFSTAASDRQRKRTANSGVTNSLACWQVEYPTSCSSRRSVSITEDSKSDRNHHERGNSWFRHL
jgi:hypothetical protein